MAQLDAALGDGLQPLHLQVGLQQPLLGDPVGLLLLLEVQAGHLAAERVGGHLRGEHAAAVAHRVLHLGLLEPLLEVAHVPEREARE